MCERESKVFSSRDRVRTLMWSPVASATAARAWKRGMLVATVGVGLTIALSGSWTTPPHFNILVMTIGIVTASVVSVFAIALTVVARTNCGSCGRRIKPDFLLCPSCGVRLR